MECLGGFCFGSVWSSNYVRLPDGLQGFPVSCLSPPLPPEECGQAMTLEEPGPSPDPLPPGVTQAGGRGSLHEPSPNLT